MSITAITSRAPGRLVINVCGIPVACQKDLKYWFRLIFSFEASPDNFKAVKRKVGFMQSGSGSPSDDSSRFSDGQKMPAVAEATYRKTGNQGWLVQ